LGDRLRRNQPIHVCSLLAAEAAAGARGLMRHEAQPSRYLSGFLSLALEAQTSGIAGAVFTLNTPGPAIRWSTSSPLRAQKTRRAPLGGAGGGEPRIRHRARPASERRLLRPPAPADPHLDLPNRVRAGRACPDAQPSTTTTVRASGAMMARLVAAQAHASCKANECSQIGVHGTGLFRRARGGAPVTALPKDGPPTPAPPAASNEPTAPPPPEPVRIPMEDVSELDHRYQGRRADKPAEKRPSSRRGRPE
jgi:hypothetical protein